MIRILIFIALLGAAVLGLGWVADQPGDIVVRFGGRQYETAPIVALAALLAVALALAVLFGLLTWLLRLPRRIRAGGRARRQSRGLAALSRGLVAASAGDSRGAKRASADATKHLGEQPLTQLLEAQTALLAGDREGTERTFARMAERPETRVLGLRGLHVEARRRGDADAAQSYAEAAHRISPLPWAGQAMLDHHASRQDWTRALEAIDANLAQKTIDKSTAKRQRAVLQTAIALELADKDADEALKLASQAVTAAPDLVPATTLVGSLLGRRADVRKASRIIEGAWRLGPHPDLAKVYLGLRTGDSAADRLKRAQTLARLAPDDPESRVVVARAAIGTRDFATARESMAPMISGKPDDRPNVRFCMTMAEIEEAENGPSGMVREWLARASRAPRDKAWVADGVVSDTWAPFSPVSGKLDAWTWQTPPERLTSAWDPSPDTKTLPAAPPEPPAPEPKRITAAPAVNDAATQAVAPDDPGPPRR